MSNAILIQHSYVGEFEPMLALTKKHNKAYCQKHGFDYWCRTYDSEKYPVLQGGWVKIELIQAAMKEGYGFIVWLDADAMIIDVETDLRDAVQKDKIGACWHRIPNMNHWNNGVLYIHNSEPTRAFVDEWLASFPPPRDGWMEQGVFNRMARAGKTVVTVSDKWNATLDVNMVPDAVVLGFHGQGDPKARYELMKQTKAQLFPDEKAETAQG